MLSGILSKRRPGSPSVRRRVPGQGKRGRAEGSSSAGPGPPPSPGAWGHLKNRVWPQLAPACGTEKLAVLAEERAVNLRAQGSGSAITGASTVPRDRQTWLQPRSVWFQRKDSDATRWLRPCPRTSSRAQRSCTSLPVDSRPVAPRHRRPASAEPGGQPHRPQHCLPSQAHHRHSPRTQ